MAPKDYEEKDTFWTGKSVITFILGVLVLICIWVFVFVTMGHAQDYSDERIVEAIFLAEGGFRATYLFGIRSIPYEDYADARQICFNTIKNNRKRFARQNKYTDYLEFLAARYCPVSASPKNKFWLKNVRYFLRREGGKGGRG